jgi:hypothetical protein
LDAQDAEAFGCVERSRVMRPLAAANALIRPV